MTSPVADPPRARGQQAPPQQRYPHGGRAGRGQPGSQAGATVGGAASVAVRALLDGPRRAARVIAAFPSAVYVEVQGTAEPRVLAIVSSDAVRLPNAITVGATSRQHPFATVRQGDEASAGDGQAEIFPRAGGRGPLNGGPFNGGSLNGGPLNGRSNGSPLSGPLSNRSNGGAGDLDPPGGLRLRVRRWWDPSPVLGPISAARLAHGTALLAEATTGAVCGLAGQRDPAVLADRCAAGDLARAVDAAERIVGLGPGLTPSGDDVLAGLLLALRLLGGSVPGGTTAVWLADWLGAAVTSHADTRTTSLAATLLHCAARGQAAGEVAAVLRGIAGQEALRPAVRRLLCAGHTSGADLAWGLLAGCRAALALCANRRETG